MQERLALLAVQLPRLLLVERVHVGEAAVGEAAVARDDFRHPRGGVAVERARADTHALELLGLERREIGGALHRPHLRPDADGAEIPDDRLAQAEVRGQLVKLAGVEAVGVARLGEQLLRARRVVRVRLERQRELEGARHEVAGGLGGAERLRLAQRAAVEGEAGGQADAMIRPRRLRIPHVEEVQEEDRDAPGEGQLQIRIALQLDRLRRLQKVGDVHLAALEHGHARRGLRDHLEHDTLDARRLAPVALEGLHHQLDARRVAHELVRAQADGMLLEAVGTDLLDVLLGHDPARAADDRPVVAHEVGPRLVQREAHAGGRDDGDLLDLVVQQLALRAVEAELHVLRGERIAVVELEALAQLELVGPLVGAHRPGLGQARGHEVAGHRLHERVVHRVEEPERRELAHDLARIEPVRRDRHVEGPAHLALGPGLGRGVGAEAQAEDGAEERDRGERAHRHASCLRTNSMILSIVRFPASVIGFLPM